MFLFVLTNLMAVVTFVCVGINDPVSKPGTVLASTLSALAPPCWLNWKATDAFLADANYTPEVWRLTPKDLNDFKHKSTLYPGKLWLFWNEPERADQANVIPSVAARLTISYAQTLGDKGTWACCGNMVDDNGLTWLNSYIAQGGPTPDVWHIHIYGAANVDDWNTFLNYWWQWWAQHGAGKPVIISETSLMWQPAAKQAELLRYLQQYTDPRVRQIYWFSALPEPSVPSWEESRLLNSDFTKTELGRVYTLDFASPTPTPTATATPTPTLTAAPPTPTATPTMPSTPIAIPTALPRITPTPTATVDELSGASTYIIYLPLSANGVDAQPTATSP